MIQRKKKFNKNLEELKMDSVPGQDSGVETEGSGIEPDQESNDSSLSSVSFSNPTPPVQVPPVVASTSSR